MLKPPSRISKVTSRLKRGFSRSVGSQTSSNRSETTSGRDLTSNQVRARDGPDTAESDTSQSSRAQDAIDPGSTTRIRNSLESARPTISTTRSRHEPHASSSSRQKLAVRLPGQEQAAAPPNTIRLKLNEVFCTLIVTYKGEHVGRIDDMIVEYEEEIAFELLGVKATDQLKLHTGLPTEALYLKVGRFRLVRHDTNIVVSRCILESQREWNEYLPQKIPLFVGQSPGVSFHIEVEWEYSGLQIEQVSGERYATTIRRALEHKAQENWEHKKYIPKKDLKKIMTEDTTSKLIREDGTLFGAEFLILTSGVKLDVNDFINKTWLWGTFLLALCVYVDLPLICFYRMWLKGLRDTSLPLTKDHCPDQRYRTNFDFAVLFSGGFKAHTFAPDDDGELEHVQLPPEAVVPILFDKNKAEDTLGNGSFGKVYKVRIDGDHHSFSVYKEEAFAFKIFYDLSAHTPMNVENESSTLARLAQAPHPNITTHLASWNQNGLCYMLFRCADCNLRTYMRQKSPAWTKSELHALLSQMRGLADGLRHIHNLGPSNLEPDRVDEKAKPGERRPTQTCFHHDLKPANILVTINPDNGNLLFSISDFGSARIKQVLSGSTQPSPFTKTLSPGDAVYSAPDAVSTGATSRPYDLWSIGCIFLELLTWMVGLEEDSVQRFADRRMQEVANGYGNQDEAFWYETRTGNVLLKPAVVQQLEILKKKCEGRGVFPLLVHLVGKLLRIRPRDRLEASQVYNSLDAIMIQVEQDLRDETFYLNNKPTKLRIAAPPSSVGDPDDFQRSPSIDEREHPARYPRNLSPNPKAHRRSTVGTVQPIGGQQRSRGHARAQSTPGAAPAHLATQDLDTSPEPPSSANGDEIPITPTISLSDYDDSARAEGSTIHGAW